MNDYKKILEGVVNIINTTEKSDIGFANICTYIGENCPELKESEDERIRKEIIAILQYKYEKYPKDPKYGNAPRWLAWLEKQGKQNYLWSKEDETGLGDALGAIDMARTIAKDENDMGNLWYAERWLKSLKERVLPQPKQEWSEEDEELVKWSINNLTELKDRFGEEYGKVGKCIDWLKSLRPQNHWKPSDEQMEALWEAYKGGEEQAALASLYSDLKKLKQ